jgi:hypothetical protein
MRFMAFVLPFEVSTRRRVLQGLSKLQQEPVGAAVEPRVEYAAAMVVRGDSQCFAGLNLKASLPS